MPTYFISAPIDLPNNDDGEVLLVIENTRPIPRPTLDAIIASWAAPRDPSIYHISFAASPAQQANQRSRRDAGFAQRRNASGVYEQLDSSNIFTWNRTHYPERTPIP